MLPRFLSRGTRVARWCIPQSKAINIKHTYLFQSRWLNGYWAPQPSLKPYSRGITTGLFGHPELSEPEGFDTASSKALTQASELVQDITRDADNPSITTIERFDDLSDILCRVADLSECIRQVHPDPKVVQKAQNACIAINGYVEELNTNIELHRALKNVLESEQFSSFDEVTQRTTESFMHDFEVSGIHLEDSTRKEVVKLNNQILELSIEFVQNTRRPALITKNQCPPFLAETFSSDSNYVTVDHVPQSSSDSKLRAFSYLAYYGTFPQQQNILEELLSLRDKLAKLVGYPTFAHRVLKSAMAESPETVSEFLEALSNKILPLAKEDAKQMQRLKLEFGDQVDAQMLRPWDTTFTGSLAQKRLFPDGLKGIKDWFPLDGCLYGLDNLFRSLFGVKLDPCPVSEGEVWDSSVRKFAFVDEKDGILGHLYCDFFTRQGKLASDCHFTVQGGRELANGVYQLPIIVLCCNFHRDVSALLNQHEVENLFHEMGHALHSMLGRPKYQNVTGTRCSTDFAEVPSILMEYFLNNSRVLSSFARHYQTNEPLPNTLMNGFQVSRSFFPAFDTQLQILLAAMDQRFHGNHPLGQSIVDVYAELHKNYAPLEYVPQTAWFLRFNHLYGYAAKYYSYLWSRAVASLTWKSCFKTDPFSREVGARYRQMLMHGGGIHPRTLVGNMLGFDPTVTDLVEALYSDVVEQRKQIDVVL